MTDATATRLYVDLLVKTVANTIYGDPPQDPWSTGAPYATPVRMEGRDWPSLAHSMIGVKRLENTRELAERAIAEGIEGDFIETGVWRGGACILMRGILAAHRETGRKVIVADSFDGLPPPDPAYPADDGDTHHTFRQLAISLEEVKANFAAYGLLDDQVEFLKGWFCDTLPGLRGRKFALLRLDGDMYQSTMDALTNLYDGLSVGGYCIIDDYGAIPSCKQAVEDFRTARGITAPLSEVDWTGVWWQKQT